MKKQDEDFSPPPITKEDSFNVLTSPYWMGVFVLTALPFFVVFFYFGTMVFEYFLTPGDFTGEQRSAFIALLSGVASDQFLRRWLYVALAIVRKPRIPFIMVWIFGCLAVISFEPIRSFQTWVPG